MQLQATSSRHTCGSLTVRSMCASMTHGRATAVHARRYAERAIREIKPPAILEPTREVLFPRIFQYDRRSEAMECVCSYRLHEINLAILCMCIRALAYLPRCRASASEIDWQCRRDSDSGEEWLNSYYMQVTPPQTSKIAHLWLCKLLPRQLPMLLSVPGLRKSARSLFTKWSLLSNSVWGTKWSYYAHFHTLSHLTGYGENVPKAIIILDFSVLEKKCKSDLQLLHYDKHLPHENYIIDLPIGLVHMEGHSVHIWMGTDTFTSTCYFNTKSSKSQIQQCVMIPTILFVPFWLQNWVYRFVNWCKYHSLSVTHKLTMYGDMVAKPNALANN